MLMLYQLQYYSLEFCKCWHDHISKLDSNQCVYVYLLTDLKNHMFGLASQNHLTIGKLTSTFGGGTRELGLTLKFELSLDFLTMHLQTIDTVGWVAGRASNM